MSLLYKKPDDVIYTVEVKKLSNGKIALLFSGDCGKFGTVEPMAEYEITPRELLVLLNKNEELFSDCYGHGSHNVRGPNGKSYCRKCGREIK